MSKSIEEKNKNRKVRIKGIEMEGFINEYLGNKKYRIRMPNGTPLTYHRNEFIFINS